MRFRKDWYARSIHSRHSRWRGRDTGEVAAVLAACHRYGQPVVPQGGLTGLAAGATPRGELVLSLERLRGVEQSIPRPAP